MQLPIWTLRDKRTCFFVDLDEAAGYAVKRSSESDVYFGCGLVEPPTGGRGSAKDVHAVTAVWADIDVAGPLHQRENLVPDVDEARRVLSAIGPDPSLLIHSGHGVQAYWLFKQAWIFADDRERDLAAGFCKRWQRTVKLAAQKFGYAVDSVSDLARVMRLPGTVNRKDPKNVVPVTFLAESDVRYDRIADLDPLLVADEFAADTGGPVQIGLITLHPDRPCPPQIETLRLNDDAFGSTWDRTRKDLIDQSPSAYDMSIANILVMGGFPDQDIADAIIAFRTAHNLDVKKALRRDYIQRTIGRARMDALKRDAAEQLAASIPEPDGTAVDPGDPVQRERRAKCLRHIGHLFGVQVQRVMQIGRENARYRMVLADGRDFPIGTINTLMTQRLLLNRLTEETGIRPGLTKKQWDALMRAILFVMEVEENPASRIQTRMTEWLSSYRAGASEVKELSGQDQPFLFEGWFYLRWEDFLRHLRFVVFAKDVTDAEIQENLKVLGFERKAVHVTLSARRTSKSYYRIEAKRLDILLTERGDEEAVEETV